jgi:hypothetical protein
MKGLSKKVGIMSGLAALALVGSAFAVWHFGTDANKATDGDYYVTKAVDYGTAVLNVTGIDAEPVNKLLILDQPTGTNGNTEEENTEDGVHWHLGAGVDFTHTIKSGNSNNAKFKYTLSFELKGKLTSYVGFKAVATPAAPVKSVTPTTYTYEWTEESARTTADFSQTIAYAALPDVEYTNKPGTIEDYNSMVSTLSADATAKIHINLNVVVSDGGSDAY